MSPVELGRGSNTVLGPIGGARSSVVVGVSWEAGALECDVCALVCGPDRQVIDDDHFLYWSNLQSPDRSVFLRSRDDGAPTPARDRAQVLVALADLPDTVDRVVVTLSTIVEGADLGGLRNLRLTAFDPASGDDVATYAADVSLVGRESCLILGEIYRHSGNWKVKAVVQGYESGLAGLGKDYGVNIG